MLSVVTCLFCLGEHYLVDTTVRAGGTERVGATEKIYRLLFVLSSMPIAYVVCRYRTAGSSQHQSQRRQQTLLSLPHHPQAKGGRIQGPGPGHSDCRGIDTGSGHHIHSLPLSSCRLLSYSQPHDTSPEKWYYRYWRWGVPTAASRLPEPTV